MNLKQVKITSLLNDHCRQELTVWNGSLLFLYIWVGICRCHDRLTKCSDTNWTIEGNSNNNFVKITLHITKWTTGTFSHDFPMKAVSLTVCYWLIITIIVMYFVSTKHYLNFLTILTHSLMSCQVKVISKFEHDCVQ